MLGLDANEENIVTSGPKRMAMAFAMLRFVASREQGATCDECTEALGLTHQSASARFHELVRVGCLVSTGQKRQTQSGGVAAVHKAATNTDFKAYLAQSTLLRAPAASGKILSNTEQEVLAHGILFVQRWQKAKTVKGRQEAAANLIRELGSLAQRDSK